MGKSSDNEITLETLISTVNCENEIELLKNMNIKNSAIIINQTNEHNEDNFEIIENEYKIMRFHEKGVGLSRNSALMRSTADICIMADDDMIYVDDYTKLIREAYETYPDADMIVFDVRIHENGQIRTMGHKSKRLKFYEILKYGTVTFTFKRKSIIKHNIFFPLYFGGGTANGSGEDSHFIWNIKKRGLKIYSYEAYIADVYNTSSSWFNGYNEEYFINKGLLFKSLSDKFSWFLNLQFAIRNGRRLNPSFNKYKIFKLMQKGAKLFEQSKFKC